MNIAMRAVTGVILFLATSVLAANEDMFENADLYLKTFVATVDQSIQTASIRHDEILEELKSVSAETLQTAETDLQVVVQYMDMEVEAFRFLKTEENAERLEKCIVEYLDEIYRLPEYVRELITTCVAELESNTTVEVEISRSKCQDYLKLADELSADVSACRFDSDVDECISRVVIEILLLTLEVPTNIEEHTRRSGDLVEFYVEAIPVCTTSRITGANVMSQTIIRYIRSCVDVVLNPPTNPPLNLN